jgi:hypothetical protein
MRRAVIRSIGPCGVCGIAVALSIGLTGCAPLVHMDEPSPAGPRISHLRFVPSGTRAGCPVSARFRLETAMEEIVTATCAWVRRQGRMAEFDRSTLPLDVDAIRDEHAEEVEARLTPNDSGTYYYYVQVMDRSGRMSNVLRGTLTVDPSWTDSLPSCPAGKP